MRYVSKVGLHDFKTSILNQKQCSWELMTLASKMVNLFSLKEELVWGRLFAR